MQNKEVSSSLWREKLDVQMNWQAFFLKQMTVFVDNPQIRFKTRFTNTAKDHRIRLLVKTHNTRPSNDSGKHLWGSDTTKQTSNFMGKSWKSNNTNKPLSALHDDEKGVTVANKGLHEYEILETTPLQ